MNDREPDAVSVNAPDDTGTSATAPANVDDMLRGLFAKQAELNALTFERNGIALTFADIAADAKLQQQWVRNYTLAITQEAAELVDSTNWKWWRTKVDLFDPQNVRVELVDILHFWISACQVMGLSADDVFRMYMQKNQVNRDRQEAGYVHKDDDDCRHIG